MPGVPGKGGPPPKRSDQRRHRGKPAAGEPDKAPGAKKVPVPAGDKNWHPAAARWYRALKSSGQSAFYEPSDWATAYLIAESISRELSPQPVIDKEGGVTMVSFPPKGASMAAWLRAMTSLMVTEGDRRRSALELQRPVAAGDGGDSGVSLIADARQRLRGAS
jgi:hypothetical protein